MSYRSITVIVPVHNSARTLRCVLEPLKAGLLPGDSLIAVNDRSSDDSLKILEELQIDAIESRGKPGAAGTRNTGGFNALTEWILFVDSDAVVPDGWRKMLAERMENAEAVQGVYSRKAAGVSAATYYKNYYYFHTFTRRIKGPFIKGCGTFFFALRRDLFEILEGFDENIAGATIEDADLSERLWALGGRIVIAPEIEVFHLREYSSSDLFRYEWNMMRAKALYILRRDPSRGAPSISVAGFREMLPVLSGAFFSWIFVWGLVLYAAGFFPGLPLAIGGFALAAAGQLPFVYHAVRDGGFRGMLASLYLFPDLLLVLPASAAAFIQYLSGRKY